MDVCGDVVLRSAGRGAVTHIQVCVGVEYAQAAYIVQIIAYRLRYIRRDSLDVKNGEVASADRSGIACLA